MDIRDIRRQNLNTLLEREFAGVRGAQSRMAEKLNKPQNFISRCLASPERKGAKTIGEDFAREIETAFGLQRYALDILGMMAEPVDDGSAENNKKEDNVLSADFSRSRASLGEIDIPQYDVRAAMGHGQVMPSDYIETIRHITVTTEYLRSQGVSYSQSSNLAVVTGFGESMNRTFASGDPLIIDRGINSVVTDGVYLFTLSGALLVKRLQILPHGIRVISDNEAFPPYEISGNDLRNLAIHARVLLAWRSQRL